MSSTAFHKKKSKLQILPCFDIFQEDTEDRLFFKCRNTTSIVHHHTIAILNSSQVEFWNTGRAIDRPGKATTSSMCYLAELLIISLMELSPLSQLHTQAVDSSTNRVVYLLISPLSKSKQCWQKYFKNVTQIFPYSTEFGPEIPRRPIAWWAILLLLLNFQKTGIEKL